MSPSCHMTEVYSSATAARLRIINSVYHAGMYLAAGALRSSPISNLLVDADEPSLDLFKQSIMVHCWHRFH